MRELRRLAWAAAIAAVFAGPAFGQQTTGGTTGTTGTTLGTTSSALGGNTQTTGGNATGSGTQLQGTTLMTVQAAPKINPPSMLNTTNSNVAVSNFLGKTYSNPMYQGYISNYNYSASAGIPGGFGAPLVPATTGTGTQGAGGRGGAGGVTGSVNSQDPGGTIVPLPKQIAYPAQLQFQVPVVPTQVFTDIRTGLDRSPSYMLANPRGVQVVMDGPNVILRGTVKDNDEYRLVESVVRVTPGVREIKNELVYPK